MNFKTRLIISRIIVLVIGGVCIGIGIFKSIEDLLSIGVVMLAVGILRLIKQWKDITDSVKIKELENTYNDERVIFIARKSYSFAFWTTIYTEFIAILVALYFGKSGLSQFLGVLVCFQVVLYGLANIFYSKKY